MKESKSITCPACEAALMKAVREDMTYTLSDGVKVVVPKLAFHRCPGCGETSIPAESARRADAMVAKVTEQMAPEEVADFLKALKLDQKTAAQALGLGEKTFHAWVCGKQTVSRSMSFYLRALRANPDFFRFIQRRAWHKSAPLVRSVKTTPRKPATKTPKRAASLSSRR
jgi:putative zinc finger/helix-turn-helix YgiT family protein